MRGYEIFTDINLISAGLKEMFEEPVFVKCFSGGPVTSQNLWNINVKKPINNFERRKIQLFII